ncbi:putative dUTPase [Pseudomonas phage PaVOA]|nr:putative dUTPase [Pseudomonas phage PaVOB]WLJ70975.1 putative dUTPase [Pseudomonas phage PaVOA]
MKFILKPDMQVDVPGRERVSEVSVSGTKLTVDGVEHDFSPFIGGGFLPPQAYIGRTPFQEILYEDGNLFIRYIHQVTLEIFDAQESIIEPFLVTEDGPVEMPFDFYRLGRLPEPEGSGNVEVSGSPEGNEEPSGTGVSAGERADSDRTGSQGDGGRAGS